MYECIHVCMYVSIYIYICMYIHVYNILVCIWFVIQYILQLSVSIFGQTTGHCIGFIPWVESQSDYLKFNIYIYTHTHTHTHNRIQQCALPVTTIMALWQLVNLGTRCTVTHCRIALWSHQSAQTASSEWSINANSECLSERLSTQSIRVLNRIYLEHIDR